METSSSVPPETLLKEVHHRMKNHMSTLVGLFTLQSAQSEDDRVRSALRDASSRAASMMVLYEKLYQQHYLHRLDVATYLPSLVNEIVSLFSCCNDVDVRTRVEELSVSARQAQPLTLLVNEIVTNAMKHAIPTQHDPRLDLGFARVEGMFELSIADNGSGDREVRSGGESTGFGMDLVDMLVQQLRGSLEIRTENGTRVTIRFPSEDAD